MKAKTNGNVDEVIDFHIKTMVFRIVGTTPLLMHRQGPKMQKELLYPKAPTNKVERQTTLKHNPTDEFRSAMHRNRDEKTPTLLHIPNGAFKAAIAQAAIDLPGASKAQLGRLISIVNETVFVYGKPYLRVDMVRTLGMNRTPDVRIRPCFPQWCCELHVEHVAGLINPRTIEKMLIAAGLFVGVGDWRPEKRGDCGKWRVVESADDDEFSEIVATQGRDSQAAAYENPEYYDDDSRELIEWWHSEFKRRTTDRGHDEPLPKVAKRSNGKEIRAD